MSILTAKRNVLRIRRQDRWRPSISNFFLNDPATTEIYTLSLHDALPISQRLDRERAGPGDQPMIFGWFRRRDRKSTRLNSSHSQISYAVFCLKKKKNIITPRRNVFNMSFHVCSRSPL